MSSHRVPQYKEVRVPGQLVGCLGVPGFHKQRSGGPLSGEGGGHSL